MNDSLRGFPCGQQFYLFESFHGLPLLPRELEERLSGPQCVLASCHTSQGTWNCLSLNTASHKVGRRWILSPHSNS